MNELGPNRVFLICREADVRAENVNGARGTATLQNALPYRVGIITIAEGEGRAAKCSDTLKDMSCNKLCMNIPAMQGRPRR